MKNERLIIGKKKVNFSCISASSAVSATGFFSEEKWVKITLGARGFSCAVSGVGHVSIVTRAKNLWSRARFL